jgi:2-phosphosulfolactate phosphatase
MSESEWPAVFVHLLPALVAPGAIDGGAAVVVDVLRASTVMVRALAAGCEAVVPCLEVDEARRLASERPRGSALLAGERQGLPIPGFDLGNSPGAFTAAACRGKTLVMTTTNGTRALLACRGAERVFVAAFANRGATVSALSRLERPVHIVASGTDGHISFEDAVLAGSLVRALRGGSGRPAGNDQALIAAGLWDSVAREVDRGVPLAEVLARGRGGRRVREIGLAPDIQAAAEVDSHPLVAELLRDPLRVVRTGP